MKLRFSCFLLGGFALLALGAARAQPAASAPQTASPSETVRPTKTSTTRSAVPVKISAPTFGNGTSMLAPTFSSATDRAGSALAFFNPSLTYSLQYGDGLASAVGTEENTVVQQLTPSVYIVFAEKTNLTYSPSFTWYSSDAYDSTVSHTASASTAWRFGEAGLSLGQNYTRTNAPLIETGVQTKQETWATNFDARYPLGERTSLNGGLGRSVRNTDAFTDVETWSASVALSRVINAALTANAALSGAYNSVDPGADLLSRTATVGAAWTPSPKISANLNVGLDFSEFSGEGKQSTNPVYNGSLSYQLFEATALSLSAQRSTNSSYYANQFTRNTSYTAAVSQRFLQRFFFSGSVSWARSSYVGRMPSDLPIAREDDSWLTSAQIGTQFLRKFSTALTWSHTEVDSNSAGVTRKSTLWGVSISWRF